MKTDRGKTTKAKKASLLIKEIIKQEFKNKSTWQIHSHVVSNDLLCGDFIQTAQLKYL